MIGVPAPKSFMDKIAELLEKLDSRWFEQIKDEISRYEFFDEQGGGFFLDTPSGDKFREGEGNEGSYCSLESFSWNNKILHVKDHQYHNRTLCGKDIFSEVVEITQSIISKGANIMAGYVTITNVKRLCDEILFQRLSESADEQFKLVLSGIRRRGGDLLDRAFIDYTETETMLLSDSTIKFNLNQDTLAYFLAVLIKGGIIEQTKEEIAPFAQKHFLVKKEGQQDYSTLSHFKKKLDNFFNGSGRSSDTPRETIMVKINNGISAIRI